MAFAFVIDDRDQRAPSLSVGCFLGNAFIIMMLEKIQCLLSVLLHDKAISCDI